MKGAKVQLSTCTGAPTPGLVPRGGSAHTLVRSSSGLCLDLPDGKPVSWTQLQVWNCNWLDAQRWTVPG